MDAPAAGRGRPPGPPPPPHGHPRGAAARKGAGGWTVSGGHPPVSDDGTGYHSSRSASCRSRCGRERRDGTGTWYHQALGAPVVHPDIGEVPPPAPEPTRREDGPGRNDCGRNAAGRARRGPPPGAPAHEGDRRRGRAGVQRAARQAIEERDPPFMPGGRPGDHGPLPAGPGPAKPDRHGRGATGRPAPSRGPGGTTGCRPTTRTST